MKIKRLFKETRVIILIVFLLISFFSINNQFSVSGLTINSVDTNSSAYESGIRNPTSETSPTAREKIISINTKEINSLEEYNKKISEIPINTTITIKTTKQSYSLLKVSDDLGLTLSTPPTSNLRKGLDLQGGTRVVLQPQGKVDDSQVKDIIDTMESRLNVYGLSDVTIKSASDLEGSKFIIVEIAGVTKEQIKNLVENQGKFEAKIANETVFEGGKKDITFVCRTDATCSRIITPCQKDSAGYNCRFEFEISLSKAAAEKQASITEKLAIVPVSPGQRALNESLELYLDGVLVDSLQIDASLKGQEATRIVISGPGVGSTEKEAIDNAIEAKNNLQTVLITGSLPTKLTIEKIDTISPSLGESFLNNAIIVGILAIVAVGLIIHVRYRKLKITGSIMFTLLCEIYLILGFAALFKQNLDLAAIAAILAAVGTGVDDQIVIIDENLHGGSGSIKQSTKKAFFVIFVAYAATVAAMLPLLRAGAGLLTGFAVVTIVGVTLGVFVTRPAFAAIIRVLMED